MMYSLVALLVVVVVHSTSTSSSSSSSSRTSNRRALLLSFQPDHQCHQSLLSQQQHVVGYSMRSSNNMIPKDIAPPRSNSKLAFILSSSSVLQTTSKTSLSSSGVVPIVAQQRSFTNSTILAGQGHKKHNTFLQCYSSSYHPSSSSSSIPRRQLITTIRQTQQQQQQQQQRSIFSWSSSSSSSSLLLAASSNEEDLELTRQIILGNIRKDELDLVGQDDDDNNKKEDENVNLYTTITTPATEVDMTTCNSMVGSWTIPDRPKHDIMIRVALGESLDPTSNTRYTPIWLFRQAGRHLPEYRQYKEQKKKNFLELLQDPMDVAECTLQPIRRYPVDAAILFSDILVVVEAMGIPVTMPGGIGIQIPQPIHNPEEMNTQLAVWFQAMKTSTINTDSTTLTPLRTMVLDRLGHVMTAVRQIRSQLATEDRHIPLIGFSAAPWTLLFYMVGGSSKKNPTIGVNWLQQYPVESQQLLDLLTQIVIEYLSGQIMAGCHMIQIFEAMGMMIDTTNFQLYALPCLEKIGLTLKQRFPTIPLMIFTRGKCEVNPILAQMKCFDVITMDGSVDRSTVRSMMGPNVSLQGNYDPAELIEENGKTIETVKASAQALLEELGPHRLIANLGEGLGGNESPLLVDAFINAIHEESAKMMAENEV